MMVKHQEAGHFVQEWGAEVAELAMDFFGSPLAQQSHAKL